MSQSSELRSVYLTSFSKTRVVAPAAVRPGGGDPHMLVGDARRHIQFTVRAGEAYPPPPPRMHYALMNLLFEG